MGLGADRGHRVAEFPFAPGDLLLLYTDGAVEARGAAGEFYPLPERLARRHGRSPPRLVQQLHRDLLDFTGGELRDDVALLACARQLPPRTG